MVRLTQMKWKGTVSHRCQTTIAPRFASANANQASSTDLRRRESISGMTNGLDRRRGPERPPQTADADVDHIGARVEVVAPDLREQALAAHHLTGALEQVVEHL